MYCLVNTFNALPGDLGEVKSCHHTKEAVHREKDRRARELTKHHGRGAYLPFELVRCKGRVKVGTTIREGRKCQVVEWDER